MFVVAPALFSQPTAGDLEWFEKRVRPVLASRCYGCHGPERQRADLRLVVCEEDEVERWNSGARAIVLHALCGGRTSESVRACVCVPVCVRVRVCARVRATVETTQKRRIR